MFTDEQKQQAQSSIDDKKNQSSVNRKISNYQDLSKFIMNYLKSIVINVTIYIFIFGTICLFITKTSQANILPDDMEMAPYTMYDRIVKDIPIDVNIMKPNIFSQNKDSYSQKAIFNSQEYLDSFNKNWLYYIKKNATPNSGIFSNASLF